MNDPLWVETPFRLQELQSDSELLEVYVQSGRRWAAEALIRRHAGMVAGVIRRLISHRSDAEDAFQATFLIMLKSAQKIRKTKSLASWLYGVAYRTALRVRSQSHKRRASGMEVQEVEVNVEESDPRSILARKLELDSLDEELQELPASLREPLVEHYLLGRTAAEIADRMDVSLTAVEGRLKRGRRMLRRRLAIRGVSLSVVLAGAAWFQKQACAMEASEWLDKLFDAPVFQSSDPSGLEGISDPTDPTLLDPQLIDSTIAHQNLSHLVQGELIVRKMMIGKLIGSTCLTLAAIGGISYATYPLQFGGPGINTGSSEVSITRFGYNRRNPRVRGSKTSPFQASRARNWNT